VDDCALNLIPLDYLLQSMGMICQRALSGQEAIDLFVKDRKKKCCETKYLIVFMDLNMPFLDGFQATERILGFQMALIDK